MIFDEAQAVALGVASLGYLPSIRHMKRQGYYVAFDIPNADCEERATHTGERINDVIEGYFAVATPKGKSTALSVFTPPCGRQKENPTWKCQS